ncbi:MAG: hypothetical protein AB7F86_17950 [Bdellovibrionales bacterium]
MKNWDRWIERFFFDQIQARELIPFRLAAGTLSILWLLLAIPTWTRDYGASGILGYGHEFSGRGVWIWSFLDPIFAVTPVWIPWLLMMLFSALFVTGRWTRTMAALLWIFHTIFLFRNVISSNAEQTVMRMLFFYSMFLPLDGKGSAEAWRWRMPQFHICAVYLISTICKIKTDPAWLSGDTMYYVLINPLWSKFPYPEIVTVPGVSKLLTWSSLLLEGSFAFLIWTRWKNAVAIAMVCFHILIALALNHVAFFSLSVACGCLLFLDKRLMPHAASVIPPALGKNIVTINRLFG